MDTPIIVAIISATAVIIVPALSFYYTKKREREADWRRYKFEHYQEFIGSVSGIVGSDSSPDGNIRFAASCNTMHLIAPAGVLSALYDFQDEISARKTNHS